MSKTWMHGCTTTARSPPPLQKKRKGNERWKVFTVHLLHFPSLLRWCYNSSVLLKALDPYLTYERWSSDFFMIKLTSCAKAPTPFPFCGERSVGLQWFQFWFCHIGSLVCFEEIGGTSLEVLIFSCRSSCNVRGFELDGWTWPASFALHCSFHTW